ncbi:MAG TPA: imidazolonepropionase [Chitinophagaceae bacterium]|nr:imidazolonepropionase [Chitinophagaceae bacterium]
MPVIRIGNIRQLVGTFPGEKPLRGSELSSLPSINNAYLVVEDGIVADFGEMTAFPGGDFLDASGKFLLPCWCDSHTHLVFAASREAEFVDKIRGMSYAEIAARGGGILNSARAVQQASEDELFRISWERLEELARLGTGAVEIKSGYGLTPEAELKMLRVIRRLKERSQLLIRATFLGAHSYPLEFRENHQGYIDQIIRDMLPVIAREKLADYVDVFCETGFFSATETETILRAALEYGLRPKLHTNQMTSIGGIEVAARLNAISADHLETMSEEEIEILAASETIATVLPTAAFFLRMPFQPARRLVDAGAALAIASDYNPGSSPSGNMNLVVSMACIGLRLRPEEAVNAATVNGACAMGVQKEAGSITVGKKANIILTRPIPSLAYLPYCFGSNLIENVMINGHWIH